jgi:hypothetical protein
MRDPIKDYRAVVNVHRIQSHQVGVPRISVADHHRAGVPIRDFLTVANIPRIPLRAVRQLQQEAVCGDRNPNYR